MHRRRFLQTSLATGAIGLTGCQANSGDRTRILGLKDSVAPQMLNRFRQEIAEAAPLKNINYGQSSTLKDIFEQLQSWRQEVLKKREVSQPWIRLPWSTYDSSNNPPDLVTLGDYWLELAIRQELITPLNAAPWKHWKNVDPIWQTLVKRNTSGQLTENGQVWAAPYRWGATIIVYRTDIFEEHKLQPPTDWQDLFRPELKGKFSLPDSPREVIGLALKHLGKTYTDANTGKPTDLSQISELESTLQALHQQAKLYSSAAYLQPLLIDHTWAAVGWSSDILPLLRNRSNLGVVLPASGTTLWADMWVRPQRPNDAPKRDYDEWIDAFWQDGFAENNALLSRGGSPLTQRIVAASQTEKQNNPLLNVEASQWNKCEPLPPLDEATIRQYDSLWRQIRSTAPA